MWPVSTSVSVASCRAVIFSVGERVSFQPDGHPLLFATIIKYNRKTVTLITGGGQQWNVAPTFLRKLTPMGPVAWPARTGTAFVSPSPLARPWPPRAVA
jgi:hypothetical protein